VGPKLCNELTFPYYVTDRESKVLVTNDKRLTKGSRKLGIVRCRDLRYIRGGQFKRFHLYIGALFYAARNTCYFS
jgi:hypothetical protein